MFDSKTFILKLSISALALIGIPLADAPSPIPEVLAPFEVPFGYTEPELARHPAAVFPAGCAFVSSMFE